MRTFKFAFIATCLLGSQAMAVECPTVDTVKTALNHIFQFQQLPNLVETAIDPHGTIIDKETGGWILGVDFEHPTIPVVALKKSNVHGTTNCIYSIDSKVIMSFAIK